MKPSVKEVALAVIDVIGLIALRRTLVSWLSHYSGPRLLADRHEAQAVVGAGELELAGVHWPPATATKNFAVLGLPETGKSALTSVFLRSVCRRFGDPLRVERVVLFDAKNTQLPFLSQILPDDVPIYSLSPLTGFAALDLAATVTTPAVALKVAATVVPDSIKTNDDFWPKQGRLVVYAVLKVLMRYGGARWRFADLVKIIRSLKLTYAVLKLDPDTAHQAADITGRLGKSIVASIRSFIGEMEIAAAGWEHAPVTFTLADVARGRCCLHLGLDPAVAVALRGVYAAVLDLLGDLLLERTGHGEITWWVLDELAQLPPVAAVRRLGLLGRESEAAIFATLQDILSLEIAWGEKQAREFLNMLQTVVCLRVGHETAKWFCDKVGERFVVKRSITHSSSGSMTEMLERLRLLTESDLTSLPHASPAEDRVTGFCHSPYADPFAFDAPFVARLRGLPPATLTRSPTRTADQQTLRPFTLADVARLNLPLTDALLKAVSHSP